MAIQDKDKSLKLAAAAVTAVLLLGLGGGLFIRSAWGLVAIIGLQAVILIGTGMLIGRVPSKNDDKNR